MYSNKIKQNFVRSKKYFHHLYEYIKIKTLFNDFMEYQLL